MTQLTKKYSIDDLLKVMQRLRDPENGCVWDKQQSYESLLSYTIEEVYEVAEAIKTHQFDELPGELGDLLFQIVFYAQIAKEEERFDFSDIVNGITEKMIRRHPHVFADVNVSSVEEQSRLWEKIKKAEDKAGVQKKQPTSALNGINKYQPSIDIAYAIQKKAATTGFEWTSVEGPLNKITEEFLEVKEAIDSGDDDAIKDELGDLFFAVVNLSRHLGVNPADAIELTNIKFERRFRAMERMAKENNQIFSAMSLDEMEEYWSEVKRQQRE